MKKNSIVVHIILLLMIVIVLQAAFSLNTIIWTDITTKIESFSYTTFTKTLQNRKGNLESFMNSSWSNINSISEAISENYANFGAGDGFELSEEEKILFLDDCVELVIEMISKTRTTGGFIILDDGENMKYDYSSIYLKNDNYLSQTVNSDTLTLIKGATEISKKYSFSLSSSWSYALKLDESSIDILNKPMEAVDLTQNLDYLGYWAVVPSFSDSKSNILTYTVPILDDYNNPIGVVGIEVTEDYLYKFLPSDEFGNSGSYGYVLATNDLDNATSFTPIMINGYVQDNLLDIGTSVNAEQINLARHDLDAKPLLFTSHGTDICVYYEDLKLYPNNSPFFDDNILLVGMVDLKDITSFTEYFWSSMLAMFGITLVGGILISYVIGKRFALPIIKLSKAVSTKDIRQEMKLPKTNIEELDDLANVIEALQKENMIRNSTKTDKILELLNMGVGSFEYIKGTSYVTVSGAVHKMLGLNSDNPMQTIEKDLFFDKIKSIKMKPIEEMKNTYSFETFNDGNPDIKYYTIEEYEQEDAILGVIEDTTEEVEDLLILNYERNYDLLTGILNRRAFIQKVEDVFKQDDMEVAAFVMFDLDNLKYVNDTFGHDSGDIYIKTAANIIFSTLNNYGVVGRMSGDEFYAYLHSFNSKEALLDVLNTLYRRLENEPIIMPDSKEFQIRMSGGIAWYNEASSKLDELMKYADFAMYKGKQSLKGELREFDNEQYIKEAFMLSGKGELNKILDDELVNFVFQPIIDIKNGEIYAYEALMRPISETLGMPDKFLQIATLEGKLWKVEKMTFFKTLYLYNKYEDLFNGARMFINSIPSENLTDKEYSQIKNTYKNCLPYLVVEITEQEQQEESIMGEKLRKLNSLGVKIALDDYGSGYANDVNLLNLKPNILKIDRSLISNVHIDPSRQTIVNKIIVFCKENNISVLGEGIETEQELEYLINAGIDLAQGYYISRPIELPNFDNNHIRDKIAELK